MEAYLNRHINVHMLLAAAWLQTRGLGILAEAYLLGLWYAWEKSRQTDFPHVFRTQLVWCIREYCLMNRNQNNCICAALFGTIGLVLGCKLNIVQHA